SQSSACRWPRPQPAGTSLAASRPRSPSPSSSDRRHTRMDDLLLPDPTPNRLLHSCARQQRVSATSSAPAYAKDDERLPTREVVRSAPLSEPSRRVESVALRV